MATDEDEGVCVVELYGELLAEWQAQHPKKDVPAGCIEALLLADILMGVQDYLGQITGLLSDLSRTKPKFRRPRPSDN